MHTVSVDADVQFDRTYSTPSHGGYYVPLALGSAIPARWREFAALWSHGNGDGWYEEDVAAIAVLLTFPTVSPEVVRRESLRAMLEAAVARRTAVHEQVPAPYLGSPQGCAVDVELATGRARSGPVWVTVRCGDCHDGELIMCATCVARVVGSFAGHGDEVTDRDNDGRDDGVGA